MPAMMHFVSPVDSSRSSTVAGTCQTGGGLRIRARVRLRIRVWVRVRVRVRVRIRGDHALSLSVRMCTIIARAHASV